MSGVPALGTDKNAWRNSITIPEGLSGNLYVRAAGTQMLRRAFVMSGLGWVYGLGLGFRV